MEYIKKSRVACQIICWELTVISLPEGDIRDLRDQEQVLKIKMH